MLTNVLPITSFPWSLRKGPKEAPLWGFPCGHSSASSLISFPPTHLSIAPSHTYPGWTGSSVETTFLFVGETRSFSIVLSLGSIIPPMAFLKHCVMHVCLFILGCINLTPCVKHWTHKTNFFTILFLTPNPLIKQPPQNNKSPAVKGNIFSKGWRKINFHLNIKYFLGFCSCVFITWPAIVSLPLFF